MRRVVVMSTHTKIFGVSKHHTPIFKPNHIAFAIARLTGTWTFNKFQYANRAILSTLIRTNATCQRKRGHYTYHHLIHTISFFIFQRF
jgi:hypothetical protein